MYIETVPNRNSRSAILLREGWHEGRKVHKRTLANLTGWPARKVALLPRLLRDEPLIASYSKRATRSRLQADPDTSAIIQDTEPTPLQRRAVELVRAFPVPRT